MSDTKQGQPSIAQNKLLALSFIEGSCVMVAELAGGKMLAPYYGTSLYVWASTLALTLGGLTAGYYIGGELSKKEPAKRQKTLFTVIAIAAALVVLMPVIGNFVMQGTLEMEFLTGLVCSQFIFLLPPILCMGIVSPMLISMIAETNTSGKAAGLVYAISTLGGVIATLLTGFVLVPIVGIATPCMVGGAILFLTNVFVLRPGKKIVAASLLLLLVPTFFFIKNTRESESDNYKILYHSEGMLGQIKIVDFTYKSASNEIPARCMMVNHIWQTWIDRTNPDFSFLYYTRFTEALISSLKPGNRALQIGLGGGTVLKQMEKHGVSYDAVEIDGRLPELAEKYFGLKNAVANTVFDDGRHYINVCKKKYDLIVIDALLGENIPSHLLSVECFREMRKLLTPTGKIFIEFDGIMENTNNVAPYALLNTIKKADLACKVYTSVQSSKEFDLMYVIHEKGTPQNYDSVLVKGDNYYKVSGYLKQFETSLDDMQVDDVITDDRPILDFYLREKMVVFRQNYLKKYTTEFMEEGVPFFY